VRVADKYGPGKVKVTLSFADWKEGKVEAATYELPVPEPARDKK
jgi:hypothetical protein